MGFEQGCTVMFQPFEFYALSDMVASYHDNEICMNRKLLLFSTCPLSLRGLGSYYLIFSWVATFFINSSLDYLSYIVFYS